jgi:hypothetical protein
MMHLLRILSLAAVLVAAICTTTPAGAQDGWERGGQFKNSRYDNERANDTEAGTQARESDASITTDKPASAEPFENPADIQDDEDED